nr:RNA-directed DNA polymerase, eukaryota, reverse transcriptase zinc-binding domain protein [Tanacetum cinerariifolium]
MTMRFQVDGKPCELKGIQTNVSLCSIEKVDSLLQKHSNDGSIQLYSLQLTTLSPKLMHHSNVNQDQVQGGVTLPWQELVDDFQEVFQAPKSLPPERPFDHRIILKEGTTPISQRPYRYPAVQKDIIKRTTRELLEAGVIRNSQSSFAAPVVLMKKKDGQWRMCMDYRRLNDSTVKDKFPELGGATWFSKLDLHFGYHQGDEAQRAFEELKSALTSAPVLALPDFSKQFVIETDASGYGLGAVLMQERHPISYLSKALLPKQQTLSVYEKKLLAILMTVKQWHYYLITRPFIIRTDQNSLRHLLAQKVTTPLQHKWLAKLLGYDYTIEYKKGRENVAADALSRVQGVMLFTMAISQIQPLLLEKVIASQEGDIQLQAIKEQIKKGVHLQKITWNGKWLSRKNRMIIGGDALLRAEIIILCHESPLGGHSGVNATDRIVWIDVEGIPLRAWSKTTFNKIVRKWGELVFMDDSNSANKYSLRICVKTTFSHLIAESLKVIIKSKVYMVRVKEVIGWVPDFGEENSDEFKDYSDNNSVGKKNWVESEEGEIIPESVQNDAFIDNIAVSEPINEDSRKNQSDSMAGPVKQRNGFSILERFQEFIDIGQAMGYKMKGCEKHFRRIITSLGDETKMVSLDVFVVKNLWGNMLFDFATTSARGRSGGILCVWDKLLFYKKRTYVTEHCLYIEGNGLPDDLTKYANLFRDLKDIDYKDSIDLAQKAKIKWAVEGDENSKIFHGIVNKKRRHLAIKAWDRSLFDVNFPRCSNSVQVFDLEDMVSNEEIKRAAWDCGSDKSPGPDDFTFEFFKNFWTIVGGDLRNAIKEFFISSSFPKGCNSSFIALIHKVMNSKHFKDFRLISLIGCQYKIIGKILANRLSLVIGDIARKEQLLMFKVDFQKAFDSVRWDHLDDILSKYGFEIKWRGGLRQGDLLSPFLFILVMESLHVSFQRLIDRGMFDPILLGKENRVPISHLFYADDAMFIGKWSRSNVNVLMMMLHCFSLASGLKVNVHKSSIYGVGVRQADVHHMAKNFGCISNNLPFT